MRAHLETRTVLYVHLHTLAGFIRKLTKKGNFVFYSSVATFVKNWFGCCNYCLLLDILHCGTADKLPAFTRC